MSKPGWEFTSSVPENYDRYLVPILFDRFAEDLTTRLDARPRGDVLEVACGTGAVTRRLRAYLPEETDLVATDLSAAMLAVAQRRLPEAPNLAWRLADVNALPFESGRFAAAVFQFGLMFVADPKVALCELRRVLKDDGLLVMNVWDAPQSNPHARIVEEVAREFLTDQDVLGEFARPFSMSDVRVLRAILTGSGFGTGLIETVRREAVSPSALDFARGAVFGSPRGEQFRSAGLDLEEVVHTLSKRLAMAGGDAPCRLPVQALVVGARCLAQRP
ncbi:MAG: methyltransferase domain-containing protein [Burkholderiaceae bacterium]|jgi:ubiquinone/menaquinone biosynthesis C-methylase UbiE